jgi:O-antigen/teichoic acid export membrane protein
LGKDAAGLFNVASVYSAIILINYAWLIGNVSLSGFAAKQDDPDALRSGFLRVYELLVATTLPIHVLGFVLAPLLFAVFMPGQYGPALVSFQSLLAFSAVRSLAAHVAPFYNAINKAYINLYFFLFSTPVCVAAMYFACAHGLAQGGTQQGLDALAIATAVTQSAVCIASLFVVRFVLSRRDLGLVRRALPYAISAVLAAVSAKLLVLLMATAPIALPERLSGFLILVVATAAGLGIYAAALYMFARPRLAVLVRDAVPGKLRDRVVYRWLPQLRNA